MKKPTFTGYFAVNRVLKVTIAVLCLTMTATLVNAQIIRNTDSFLVVSGYIVESQQKSDEIEGEFKTDKECGKALVALATSLNKVGNIVEVVDGTHFQIIRYDCLQIQEKT